MSLKYESDILFNLMKRDGDDTPSDVLPYESELKEKYVNQVLGAYPKLQDYRPEWLNYNLYRHLPSDFPVETVSNVTNVTFQNVVPYAYKSAILKGNTLVNLSGRDRVSSTGFSTYENGVYKHLKDVNHYYDALMFKEDNVKMFSPNKTYTFIIGSKVLKSEVDGYTEPPRQHGVIIQFEDGSYQTPMTSFQNVGERIEQKIKFTIENKPIKNVSIRTFTTGLTTSGIFNGEVYKLVLVEGDYTNEDIPYFEGMQSVRMPVLTTSNEDGTKTNILTTPSDLTLRGIGDVKDTLDCLTGEVTERVGEIVLDGSQQVTKWNNTLEQPNTLTWNITIDDMMCNSNILSDKLKFMIKPSVVNNVDEEAVSTSASNNKLYIRLNKSRGLTEADVMNNLSQNPITVSYQLATESIKTVDLTCIDEQGKNVNFMPIEGTMHVKTASNGLQPLLDMSVPVEAITQNLNSFANMKEE